MEDLRRFLSLADFPLGAERLLEPKEGPSVEGMVVDTRTVNGFRLGRTIHLQENGPQPVADREVQRLGLVVPESVFDYDGTLEGLDGLSGPPFFTENLSTENARIGPG